MRRLPLFVPLLALVSAFSAAAERTRPEDVGLSSQRLSRIGEFVRGEVDWGGIFNTVFWVDPEEELILVFLTNFSPYDLEQRWYVKTLVYQAIQD